MFGYIRCSKEGLTEENRSIYESFYCGLCANSGKEFGSWSRLLLSYDMAFLAILTAAVKPSENIPENKQVNCLTRPWKKREGSGEQEALLYASDMSMLLTYYKMQDNVEDQKGAKKGLAYLGKGILSSSRNQVKEKFPEMDRACAEVILMQLEVEKNPDAYLDQACHPTALGLAKILANADHLQANTLYDFGYLLGRWIYLIDAVDDFPKDLKAKNFNIWKNRYPEAKCVDDFSADALEILNRTKGALADRYQALELYQYKEILDNIVYQGMPQVQRQVFAGEYVARPKIIQKTANIQVGEEG